MSSDHTTNYLLGQSEQKEDALSPYRARVSSLDVDAKAEDIVGCVEFVDDAIRRLKLIKAEAEKVLLDKIIESKSDITVGVVRYYAGKHRTTKVMDMKSVLPALFSACQGDLDAFAGCLSSDALKVGQCRAVMGDTFVTHFEEKTDDVLKQGKPILNKIDTRFLPPQKGKEQTK